MVEIMNTDVLIKLPPLLLQSFSINNNEAKCMKCNILCAPEEEDILFHLSVCNGSLIEENIQTLFKFNCLRCNFSTHSIAQWKCHLFKLNHISKNVDFDVITFSYVCKLCNTHFYGFREEILKHHCRPQFISTLSFLMSTVYGKYKVHHNQTMLYYCTYCSYYTYNLTELHQKTHSEVADMSVCHTCLITFYGSTNEEFSNHKLSFEHIFLWCLNGPRSVPKMSSHVIQNMPYYFTKHFVFSPLLEKFCCIVCNTKNMLTHESVYEHYYKCISSKNISDVKGCNNSLLSLNCNLCVYTCFAKDDLYKCWVDHVTSFEHLTKTVVGEKKFSYYCYESKTVFFGTDSFIKNLIMQTNNDIGRLLFVPDLMSTVYKHVTNAHFSCNISFCCGICQNHTFNQFNCVHKNNDSNLSFYCSTCLVVFNVRSDYYEHLVSSEHIILNYFKSNQLAELKIVDHTMEIMKIYLTNLNKSDNDGDGDDDDVGDDDNDGDADNPQETICQENNEMIISTQNLTSCDSKENVISKLIEKLSAEPILSAFNNFIRKNLELFIREPQTSNNITRAFYCEMCNKVLCNQDVWMKHDKEFHHKDINLRILYCDICCIEHVSAQINTKEHHLMTIEHISMEVFQKFIKPSMNTINDDNDSNYIVEIKKRKFSNEYQVKHTREDTKELENQNGFTLLAIENHDSEKVLSFQTRDLFREWGSLCTRIISDLEEMNLSLTSTEIQSRVQQLCDSIYSLQIDTDSKKIHIFGSRVYGLATNTTDIDIYLEIDDTFDGIIANNEEIQVEFVQQFTKHCLLKPEVFRNVNSICNCRVPIVTFYHVPSEFNCDVSFKSGLGTYNTKLIKFYLSSNTTVKWLVCVIVKNWALQNGLKDRNLFTSYALIWLVLFYLMTQKLVPSLIELRRKASKADHKVIEGWDCTFGKCPVNIGEVKRPELLMGFFQYYSNKGALMDNVLSTCTGQLIKKPRFYERFSQLPGLSKIQRTQFKNFKAEVDSSFDKNYGLVLQDPFELSFNLTKNLHNQALTDFCDLCLQSRYQLINMRNKAYYVF